MDSAVCVDVFVFVYVVYVVCARVTFYIFCWLHIQSCLECVSHINEHANLPFTPSRFFRFISNTFNSFSIATLNNVLLTKVAKASRQANVEHPPPHVALIQCVCVYTRD